MELLERINLVPRAPLASRIKKLVPWVSGTLFIVGCVVVLIMARMVDQENIRLAAGIAGLERQKNDRETQQELVARLAAEIKQLEQVEIGLQKTVGNLLEIPSKKKYYSQILITISEQLPVSARCEKIDLGEKGGEISGSATEYRQLPAFVARLRQSPLFDAVTLRVINQDKEVKSDLFAFTITFGLRENARLRGGGL